MPDFVTVFISDLVKLTYYKSRLETKYTLDSATDMSGKILTLKHCQSGSDVSSKRVFIVNDIEYRGVMVVVQELGILVPKDIMISIPKVFICEDCQYWVPGIECSLHRSYEDCEKNGRPTNTEERTDGASF